MKKCLLCLFVIVVFVISGCGRNASFGVVDMTRVEKEAKKLVAIRDEGLKELDAVGKELDKKIQGKSEEARKKLVEEYRLRIQGIQTGVSNRMRNELDGVIHQIAQEKKLGAVIMKEVVPEGGTDITAEVLERLK